MKTLQVEPTVLTNLTRDDLRNALSHFADSIRPGDIVFFYFSGYGLQGKAGYSEDESEEDWLLPTSFDPKDQRKVAEQAYAVSRVVELLNNAGPRIIVIDASRQCCDSRATGRGLRGQPAVSNTLIAYATALGEVAQDPPDGSVNLFTSRLISALQEPGLTPIQIFDRVQQGVTADKGSLPYVNPGGIKPFYFVDPPPPEVVTKYIETKEKINPGALRVGPKDNLQYAWIPSGHFEMGCAPNDRNCNTKDELPRHTVNINRGFWITNTEVTVSAYETFTTQTGHTRPPRTKTNPKLKYTENPVTEVAWKDAEDYCEWAGGRLPTEAEWEYAARAGTDDIYPWGNKFRLDFCNSIDSGKLRKPFDETTPARWFKSKNAWNLFDVIGNVREWVWDVYDPKAYDGSTTDPRIAIGPKKDRVMRGGSFGDGEKQLRLSARDHQDPGKFDNQTGFRCVVMQLPQ